VNFTIGDLCKDGSFPFEVGQHGLSDVELACNLRHLCVNVIEPLFEKYGHLGIKINSCFRPAGSKVSKSKGISQHELGQAVDLGFSKIRGNKEEIFKIATEIRDTVNFDQLLFETTSDGWCWIHISYNKNGNRPIGDVSIIMTVP